MTRTPFILRNPSVLAMLAVLAVLTLVVTLTSQAYGTGALPTSTVGDPGATLRPALAASRDGPQVGGHLGHLCPWADGALSRLAATAVGQWLMVCAHRSHRPAPRLAQSPIPPPRRRSQTR